MKKLFIVSTSTVYGKPYLSYLIEEMSSFFSGCKKVLFIPYARPGGISHDAYTEKAASVFNEIDIEVKGIHEFSNTTDGLSWADGFFTGGGNTFVLLNQLYENNLIEPLRQEILAGKPYMGTSAGSNITGMTISTTNDMPIVQPPSFKALELVPFNINPHYLDPNPDSTHMGETRETRIMEFHVYNNLKAVGLREGSALKVIGDEISLWGSLPARIFQSGKQPVELKPNEDLTFLLQS